MRVVKRDTNARYEQIMEDVQILYHHFRDNGDMPQTASGRTLYELEEDLAKNRALVFFSHLALCQQIMRETHDQKELVKNYWRRMNVEMLNRTDLIRLFLHGLNRKNKLHAYDAINEIAKYINQTRKPIPHSENREIKISWGVGELRNLFQLVGV